MEVNAFSFGYWVKEQREKKGISQRKLCGMIDMSASYISQLESGKVQMPSYDVAKKITLALSIDEEELKQFPFESNKLDDGEMAKTVMDVDIIRDQLIKQMQNKIQVMKSEDIAGLLQLLNTERQLIWELATMRADVKRDKVPFVMETIRSYVKFLKAEHRKENEND